MLKNGKSNGLQEFTVTAAKDSTLDWYLAQTKKDKFIINFRQKNLPQYVTDFIGTKLRFRSFGANSNRDNYNDVYPEIILKNAVEGYIFIDSTTRARPTKTGVR